jgi:hypothetical protein
MPPCSQPTGCQPTQRGFALCVVAMLLVVLLSALPGGGQARSRLVGSAFDPTTVSVALSPKQPKSKASLESADRQRIPDFAPGGPARPSPAAVAADAVGGGAAAGPGPYGHLSPPALPRVLTRAHGPRAPPAA